jgi:hypothetical protein
VTATAWTADELNRIGAAHELRLTIHRPDDTLRNPVTIWVVRVGADLYVRSWRGPSGSWYRGARTRGAAHASAGGVEKEIGLVDADQGVQDAVDAAYRDKYARYPSYVEPMISEPARATTLKLLPRRENPGR